MDGCWQTYQWPVWSKSVIVIGTGIYFNVCIGPAIVFGIRVLPMSQPWRVFACLNQLILFTYHQKHADIEDQQFLKCSPFATSDACTHADLPTHFCEISVKINDQLAEDFGKACLYWKLVIIINYTIFKTYDNSNQY